MAMDPDTDELPADGLTVTRAARRFGLSRSTLLYYDRIGLLRPSRRGDGEYRRYSAADLARLEQICRYRTAGVRLADIRAILDSPDDRLAAVLEQRLEELNGEIRALREQQRVIVGLLSSEHRDRRVGVMNRERWTELLVASGFSREDMRRWHAAFERHAPERHREFLEFLCIPEEDIQRIRAWCRATDDG
jgi:DNA-binding transcriptional MerR regulator